MFVPQEWTRPHPPARPLGHGSSPTCHRCHRHPHFYSTPLFPCHGGSEDRWTWSNGPTRTLVSFAPRKMDELHLSRCPVLTNRVLADTPSRPVIFVFPSPSGSPRGRKEISEQRRTGSDPRPHPPLSARPRCGFGSREVLGDTPRVGSPLAIGVLCDFGGGGIAGPFALPTGSWWKVQIG